MIISQKKTKTAKRQIFKDPIKNPRYLYELWCEADQKKMDA